MGVPNPMLLTSYIPAASELEYKYPHGVAPHSSPSIKGRKAERDVLPPLQVSASDSMSNQHRGLPPPAAMTRSDSSRIPPSLPSHFNGLPAPPSQWQGAEESMRCWLATKAEEEKRRQEEERSKQESFKLEQRRIEQNMLSESIRNGVPPTLLPLIFAGIGGSNVNAVSIEWLQQYAVSLQASQQHQQQQQTQPYTSQGRASGSPGARRIVNQPSTYPSNPEAQAQGLPATAAIQDHLHFRQSPIPEGQYTYQTATVSTPDIQRQSSKTATGPTSAPRPTVQNVLPRLSTHEMHTPGLPSATGSLPKQPSSAHPVQDQPSSSPSLYFHHWVPPSSQATSGMAPQIQSDYVSSPKKRKAQGAHQPTPAPSSTSQYQSPSFAHVSSNYPAAPRGTHTRQRSGSSTRGGFEWRPRATASSGNAQHSPAETEEQQRQFHRHYRVRGGAEDLNDGEENPPQEASKRPRSPPEPGSLKREGGHADFTRSQKRSLGVAEHGG